MPAREETPQEPGFGALLRRVRVERRMTQEQLAAATGLSARAISDIERGKVRFPRPETVRLLAGGLRVPAEDADVFAASARSVYWKARGAEEPAAPAGPAELPPEVPGFVGRRDVLARLDALRPGPGDPAAVVTICGGAGVGKTGLAVHWAHAVRGRYEGQLHLELRGSAEGLPPLAALGRLLRSLGVVPDLVPGDLAAATALYRTRTAGRRLLVVLDDARDAEQVRPLLPTGAGSVTLVTSRDTLTGLAAHQGASRVRLPGLDPADAAALLATVAGTEVARADPAATAEFLRLCAYQPLAVRIAAVNLADRPGTTLAGYCAELRADRFAALQLGGAEQEGVRAAYAASYRQLPAAARRLFRLLGAVPGKDLSADAAAALAGADPVACRPLIERLVAAHLVEQRPGDRLALHDLLRIYARETLAAEDPGQDRDAAVRRLLCHQHARLRGAVLTASPEAPLLPDPEPAQVRPGGGEAALAWVEAEQDTLVAGLLAALDLGEHRLGVRLADALREYYRLRPHRAEWAAVTTAGLAAARRDGGPDALASAQLGAAALYLARDRYDDAVAAADRAAGFATAAGWAAGLAVAVATAGNAHRLAGRLPEAGRVLQRARTLHRDAGLPDGEAGVLDRLGLLAHERGRLAEAADCLGAALELHEAAGCGPHHLAETWLALGDVSRSAGRLTDAAVQLGRAVDLHRRTGDRAGEAYAQRCLAEAHRDRGDLALADALAGHAAATAAAIGDRRVQAQAVHTRATVAVLDGRPRDAVAGHEWALAVATELHHEYAAVEALVGLAVARTALGDRVAARAAAEQAARRAAAAGFRLLQEQAHGVLTGGGTPAGLRSA